MLGVKYWVANQVSRHIWSKNQVFYWKILTFLPSVFSLSQRNICTLKVRKRRRGCLFKSIQAVADMILEVHFAISVLKYYLGVNSQNCQYHPVVELHMMPFYFPSWKNVFWRIWLWCPELKLTRDISASFNM